MAIEKREYDCAKECDDVMKLVVKVVSELKAKKPVAEVATGSLTELMAALSGIDQVDDEWAADRSAVLKTAVLGAVDIVDALTAKAPEAAPEPPAAA